MNLRLRHVPYLLVGGAFGYLVGWLISFIIKPGFLPHDLEYSIGIRGVCTVLGTVAGCFLAVLLVLLASAWNKGGEMPYGFSTVNGTGSTLIGKREVAPDGSYWSTEWFTALHIPLFPICRYRVTELSRRKYTLHERTAPKAAEVLKVYGIVLLLLAVLSVVVFKLRGMGRDPEPPAHLPAAGTSTE